MMSKAGLELTNFINPDLTWKTVSKGYRTGTRRSRKQLIKNSEVGAELVDRSGKMVEDVETTVSESEKLGVAVLGRRFSDKIEHVPIKKRRFMFRSPSPPPRRFAPSVEESGQLVDSQHLRSQVRPKSTSRKQLKANDASTIKFVHNTDFSGIKILADAACSNSIGDDAVIAQGSLAEESKREVIDSSSSGVPPKEAVSSTGISKCSQKDTMHECRKDDNVGSCLQNGPNMDDEMVKRYASLRDHRLHWDLNVPMDAWEQPLEVVSQANSVEGDMPQISECCESQKEDTKHKVGSTGNSVEGSLVSSEDINISLVTGTCKSDRETNLEFNSRVDNKSGPDHAQESSTEVAENVKPSIQVVNQDGCTDQTPCSQLVDVTSLQMVEDSKTSIITEYEPEVVVKQKDECDAADLKLDNDASPCEPVSEKVTCETESSSLNEVVEDPGKGPDLYDGNFQERVSIGSCPPSPAPLEPASKTEEWCVSLSAKSEVMSTSGALAGEGLHGAAVDSNRHKDEAAELNADKVGSPHHVESSHVVAPRSDACNTNCSSSASSSDKVSAGGHPVGGFDSDVCQDAKGHIISMEINKQDGYDSQFEDGELRETDLCWDNDGGEAECVDYDSDDGEAYDIDAVDYSVTVSGKAEVGSECDKEGTCASESDTDKKMKADRCRLNAVSDHVIENSQCWEDALRESGWSEVSANQTSGITEGGTIKKHSPDCVDKFDMKEVPNRAIGSKPLRREWQSGSLDRKDTVPLRRDRSDNFDDSYDKFSGRERSTVHLRGRSPSGGHSFNPSGGFRDSKRGHSPTSYGSYNSGRLRPKSVVESRGYAMASDNAISEGVTGLDNRIRRPFMNSPSNGVYRPHVRRRSPSEREDAYGMPTGMSPIRDTSPDRRRFRRYPQGINRSFREEYTEYPNCFPPRISPPRGRAPPHYPQPFKKSRSRSRSRSPIGWTLPRNRNEGPRRPSRSPEFRSKGRIEGTRMPFQRPGLEPGYEVGYMPLPPKRLPPRNYRSRWIDDRNCGPDHLRGRRSPVRVFRPNQRFDSGRPMQRMNSSDDGFRPPVMHPTGRYSDMDGARRRNGERYEVIHRVRHYDSDGPVRRFRYDTDDCFVSKHSNNNYDDCNRSSERRPRDVLPRRGSEEKDQPRSNQDQQPRSNQDQQPRFNQDQQGRFNQDQQARLNQDQQPRLNQDQQGRLNQDQQAILNQELPRFNQDNNKVMNNTSPKSLEVIEEEAA